MMTTLRYWRLNLQLWLDDNGAPLFILGALLLVLGLVQIGRAVLPQRATIIVSATATPALQLVDYAPTAAPLGGLPRAVVAYAAPGGIILGALDAGRPYTVLARYGSTWLQVDAGSGAVWIDAGAAGLVVDAQLADLAPPPAPVVVERQAPPVVVYVPQPAAPAAPPQAAPAVPVEPGSDMQTLYAPPPACDTDGDGACGGQSSGTW